MLYLQTVLNGTVLGLGSVIKYSLDAGRPVRMASNSPRAGTPLQSLSGQEQDAARVVATNDRTGLRRLVMLSMDWKRLV